MTSVRQDIVVRQRHLRYRFLTTQCASNVVIGNLERPIHRDAVINRLRERGIRSHRLTKWQVLNDIHYLLRFFYVSV